MKLLYNINQKYLVAVDHGALSLAYGLIGALGNVLLYEPSKFILKLIFGFHSIEFLQASTNP